jgi:hypothetical protein
VRKGGALLIYSLYAHNAMVHWSPGMIFQNEIRVSERQMTVNRACNTHNE